MNEKTKADGTGGTNDARGCARSEQLVSYLYGEAAPDEAAEFRGHLKGCAVCREEVAAFGGVRERVGAWREDVVGTMPPLSVADAIASASAAARVGDVETNAAPVLRPARARSASAALREFFSLSPVWLRAGTAAAALAFCAMAALILARAEVRWDSNGFAFNTGVRERVVERQIQAAPSGYTREKVDELIRQNVEREVADARARWEAENAAGAGVSNAGVVNAGGERRAPSSRGTGGTDTTTNQKAPRRNARGGARGEQLAQDNEDVFYPGEESVPRLTDILGAVKTPVKDEQ